MYQLKVKKAMHAAGPRSVSARLANSATQGQLLQHATQLQAGQAAADDHLTPVESFTGAVPKVLKGSKRYWRVAFIQLMAMCLEYGAPEFFLTLTANEMGWTDLRRACGGLSHGARPVEATRHYHHRWSEFKSRFLKGATPIGHIERLHTVSAPALHYALRAKSLVVFRGSTLCFVAARVRCPRR
mmetsp:Transcript_26495/g.77750  ORF Transcript_26495/g.77750 Transcript_26495/m.77750 type:complete len:185 (-) Transcript_26495:59-613(-)